VVVGFVDFSLDFLHGSERVHVYLCIQSVDERVCVCVCVYGCVCIDVCVGGWGMWACNVCMNVCVRIVLEFLSV
jgi:hypothetical protein